MSSEITPQFCHVTIYVRDHQLADHSPDPDLASIDLELLMAHLCDEHYPF